ncbi:hypothetical protein [Helicobacter vulpis]|uniref:hypothetical protein n=1 Tax=Helicobacter vulpis TaxID=2316076 RepID=UPI000EADCD48|nr:hypothetical protein [Helicobacter vulpis]
MAYCSLERDKLKDQGLQEVLDTLEGMCEEADDNYRDTKDLSLIISWKLESSALEALLARAQSAHLEATSALEDLLEFLREQQECPV